MPLKLYLYTEELFPPFDEGYKNFTYNLFREAAKDYEILRAGCGDPSVIDVQIKPSKFLNTKSLRQSIRQFEPDVLIYVPISSATVASFIRTRVLQHHSGGKPLAMIGLQPREYPRTVRPILSILAPSKLFVQSTSTAMSMQNLGVPTGVVYAGVDTEVFQPIPAAEKADLRIKYGLDSSGFVVVHVGHINERRNVKVLADIAAIPGVQAVLVGSSSTEHDQDLAESLRKSGVVVLAGCVERIEEIYQLADAYIFPVLERTAAVEMPLSVLEAMSCNLPILTTPFGALPDCFTNGGGFYFVEQTNQFVEKAKELIANRAVDTRNQVASFAWSSVIGDFMTEVEQLAKAK